MQATNPWDFIKTMQTLTISSINNDGSPHSSYAPFIQEAQCFYICISSMSAHTQNLLHHPQVSILFIEDEGKSHNLFARKRVTFDANVTPIARKSVTFNTAMTYFEDKFVEMANIYQTMLDFQLFALLPYKGRAVFGFGQAYDYQDGAFGNVTVGSGHKT